jgi:hypothetical protein
LAQAATSKQAALFLSFYDGLPLLDVSVDEFFTMTRAQRERLYQESREKAQEMNPHAVDWIRIMPPCLEGLIRAGQRVEL